MKQRKKLLLEENIYKSSDDFDKIFFYLSDIKKFDYLKKSLSISETLIEEKIHTLELSNWLKYLTSYS